MTAWVRFNHQGDDRFGALEGSRVIEHVGDLFINVQPTEHEFGLDEVEILTPTEPTKMVAMANNFHALIEKFGLTVPEDPLYFLKANSSFHPSEQPIRRPAGYEGKIVFEGELGIVIGKTCRQVPVHEAAQYVFGYTCINDITAFDLLNKNPSFAQWTRCKAADTFGIFGPAVATDLNPLNLKVRTLVDGQERQNYPITDMVFTPDELVSRVSYDMTLLPGDIIACGTSVGAGTLKPGNVVEIIIDGVGTLRNEFIG